MKVILQAEGSHCCGQCCIAMIKGISLDEVINYINKKGSTTVDDLVKGLDHRVLNEHLIRVSKNNPLPEYCIVRVKWNEGGSHWVVKNKKWIYDPFYGKVNFVGYEQWLKDGTGRFSSYVELKK